MLNQADGEPANASIEFEWSADGTETITERGTRRLGLRDKFALETLLGDGV